MAEAPSIDVKEIRDCYDYYMDRWREQREAAKKDLLLMANKPFTPEELKRRKKNRPLVIVDTVSQYTNQIVNNIRQNPRGVNFAAMNFSTDQQEAERRSNIARGIEKDSDAQAAYCTAFEGAVAGGGMGFMRLMQEYEAPDSDKQVLRIVRVPNHLSILPDPDANKIDFSDMKGCFVLDRMRYGTFPSEYDSAETKQFTSEMKAQYPKWLGQSDLQIAEYWKVSTRKDTLLVLPGQGLFLSELPPGSVWQPASRDPRKGGILQVPGQLPQMVSAWVDKKVPSVWQYHTNGVEILGEPYEWDSKGDSIPIYPVAGGERYYEEDGQSKRELISAVRFVSWAVKGMAYVRSLQTELAQMAPKTPWVAIEGQLEGMEGWDAVNTDPRAWLYYRAKLQQFGEQLLPPPFRPSAIDGSAIQALEILWQAFHQDLQNAMGMYRASVGSDQGISSGRMAEALDKQSDQGSFHFTHNFNQSLERLWSDINNRMDSVYDTQREVVGFRPDGQPVVQSLNDPSRKDSLQMGKGKFRTWVSIGPAMNSEEEDGLDAAEKFAQIPGVFPKVGHLLVKHAIKGPIGDEMSKLLTPPELQGPEPSPDQLKVQMQQLGQQNQALKAQLGEAQTVIQSKQIENNGKIQVAIINATAGIREAEIKAGTASDELEAKMAQHVTQLLADAAMQANQQQQQPVDSTAQGGA